MYCNYTYDQYDSVNLYSTVTNMSDDEKTALQHCRCSKVKSAVTGDLTIFHSAEPIISGDSAFSYNLNKMCSDLRADEVISDIGNEMSVSKEMDKRNCSTDIDDTDKGIADEITVTTDEDYDRNFSPLSPPEFIPEEELFCEEKEVITFQQDTDCLAQFFVDCPEALQTLNTPELEKTLVNGLGFNLLNFVDSNVSIAGHSNR
jgi:hypothetical protein